MRISSLLSTQLFSRPPTPGYINNLEAADWPNIQGNPGVDFGFRFMTLSPPYLSSSTVLITERQDSSSGFDSWNSSRLQTPRPATEPWNPETPKVPFSEKWAQKSIKLLKCTFGVSGFRGSVTGRNVCNSRSVLGSLEIWRSWVAPVSSWLPWVP